MGDLANMTDCDGRVNGTRLLRWLRSRAEMYGEAVADARAQGEHSLVMWNSSRRHLLTEMADDLAAELTPPDYPGDDGDTVGLDDVDTWPCEGCGRLSDRVLVQDNGRAWFACPACAARVDRDAVDLDDPALTGGPEGSSYVVRDASGEYLGEHRRRTPASDEATEFGTWGEAQDACERATDRVLRRD